MAVNWGAAIDEELAAQPQATDWDVAIDEELAAPVSQVPLQPLPGAAPVAQPVQGPVPMPEEPPPPGWLEQARQFARGVGREAQDSLIGAAKGAVAVPQMAVGIADLPTFGLAGWLARKSGLRFKEAQEILQGMLTEDTTGAQRAVSEAEGIPGKMWAGLKNPAAIRAAAVESAPSMLAGGVIGKALKIGKYGYAVGEGLVSAGAGAEQVRAESPSGFLTPKQVALQSASGAVTSLIGALGGKLAGRLGVDDIEQLLAGGTSVKTTRNILMRTIIGGGVEAAEELPQSMQEQIAQNLSLDKPWYEGVEESGAMGTLVGGVMGAGANFRLAETAAKPEAERQATPAAPAWGIPEDLAALPDKPSRTEFERAGGPKRTSAAQRQATVEAARKAQEQKEVEDAERTARQAKTPGPKEGLQGEAGRQVRVRDIEQAEEEAKVPVEPETAPAAPQTPPPAKMAPETSKPVETAPAAAQEQETGKQKRRGRKDQPVSAAKPKSKGKKAKPISEAPAETKETAAVFDPKRVVRLIGPEGPILGISHDDGTVTPLVLAKPKNRAKWRAQKPTKSDIERVRKAMEAKPVSEAKEPWQMTKAEAADQLIPEDQPIETPQFWADKHKGDVKAAIAAGKPVSLEVLADYPDLAPAPAKPTTEPEVKELWQMTREEYLAQEMREPKSRRKEAVATRKRHLSWHGQVTAQAFAEGKPIPQEVLADYPDLVSKPAAREGAETSTKKAYGASNKVVNQSEYEKERENIRRAARGEKLLSGFDPSLMKSAVKIGLYHLEAGIRKGTRSFADWSAKMVADFGETIRDSLPTLWSRIEKRADSAEPLTEEEVQAIARELSEEQAEKPKDQNATTDNLIDNWLADRQDSEQDADSRAARHQDELRQVIGKRSASEKLGEAFKGKPHQHERAMDAAMQVYIDLKDAEQQGVGTPAEQMAKYGGKLSDAQKNLFASSQSLPPAVQALADKIIEENKAQGEEALETEVLKNVRDNYSARLWKQGPGKIPADAVGKFGTTTARAKARTLESILHGWSLGKELQITGAIGAQQIAAKQISQAIHDRRMIKAAVSEGLLSNKKEESDWRIVEHPNFKNWQWIGKAEEGKVYGRGTFITKDGDILQEVPLYAPKDAATSLNNILGKSKLPGTGLITKWNAIFKHLLLSLSLFHHQAFLRSYIFGTHGIEGFRPLKAYRDGRRAILNYEGMTRELVRGGLTIGTVQDFDERIIKEKTMIGKVIDKIPVAAEIKNAMIALRDQQIDFLFRKLGARLKVMGALHEFQRLLKGNKKKLESGEVTREELARISAEMLNDDFGGLNLQRMRRNPTGQHIFRLLALAPDWTESNVRTMAKAIERGEGAAAYRRMWSRVFLRAGGATVLFQLLMALMDDEEDFWSMYRRQWKEGNLRWLDVDITPLAKLAGFKVGRGQRKYFSVLGHFRDPIKFVVHPVKSAKHKSSVLGSFVLEALTGTDWAGRGFTTFSEILGIDDKGIYKRSGKRSDGSTYEEGDPKGGQLAGQTVSWGNRGALEYSQMPSFMLAQAKGILPIQMQNLIGFLAGEMDGFDAVTKSMGLMTSTTYPDREKKSEYGSKEMWKSGNAEERSEQFESDLKRMSWRGEPLGYHESLTPEQMKQAKERVEERKQSVVSEGLESKPERSYHDTDESYEKKLEQRKKAQERLQEMIKTLNLSHTKAHQLLVDSCRKRDKKGKMQTEMAGSTSNFDPKAYKARAYALARLYGKPATLKALQALRARPGFVSPQEFKEKEKQKTK